MSDHRCKVCGAPAATYTAQGKPRWRTYCPACWNAVRSPHRCKVCQAPALSYTSAEGKTKWRSRCQTHYNEYMAERKRGQYKADGWFYVQEFQRPPQGVKRITLHVTLGSVTRYVGKQAKRVKLAHPERWQRLVAFWLATGWHKTTQSRKTFVVLEKFG